MRYLNPVSNPLAHYWEEDIGGVLGTWIRFRGRGNRAFSQLVGEFILANLLLIRESIFHSAPALVVAYSVENLLSRIDMRAAAKRMIDIMGSAAGILISAPLWIIIPVLIKLDSPGPVVYSQVRVGLNRRRDSRRRLSVGSPERRRGTDRRLESAYGKPFRIHKFRTMRNDAEALVGPVWATKNDRRVTRVGRILRKTRIDEIPQLINVFLGDMSLVGPRPERPFFVEKLDDAVQNYKSRFHVKPGITGLAQVEHKYDESIEDVNGKIEYDLRYITSWSLIQDIRILLKTVVVVMTARGM